jgi:integrase
MSTKDDGGWNLFRRGDGQWILQYRTQPGRWSETRVPRTHRTERAAQRYAHEWLKEFQKQIGAQPIAPDVESARLTIRSLAQRWFDLNERNPKLSPATRKQRHACITHHVFPYPEIADVPIAELGPATLRAWLRKVRDDGKVRPKWETRDGRRVRMLVRGGPLAPYTCRNVVNSLAGFFADAMAEEWGDLPANPMRHEAVRREVPEAVTLAGKHTIVHFSKPVAERILSSAAVPEWRRVRTLLAVTSGMAEGELSGLHLDDLDLDAALPVARVTKALAIEGAEGWATMRRPKTPNRVRTLPLHSLAVRALKAWRATGWARWVGRHPQPTDFVFPNASGEGWRPATAKMLRADLRAAGLPAAFEGHPYTAHATRRSFSTWLREAGVDAETRDRLMGHAPASVGERHYTAMTAAVLAKLRDAVELIELDLSSGELIALPMRAVGEVDLAPQARKSYCGFYCGSYCGSQ